MARPDDVAGEPHLLHPVQRTQTLLMETTFLDELVDVPSTREMGHTHLSEVLDRAELLPRSAVVLSHFSARYRAADVHRILADRVPEALRSLLLLSIPWI